MPFSALAYSATRFISSTTTLLTLNAVGRLLQWHACEHSMGTVRGSKPTSSWIRLCFNTRWSLRCSNVDEAKEAGSAERQKLKELKATESQLQQQLELANSRISRIAHQQVVLEPPEPLS